MPLAHPADANREKAKVESRLFVFSGVPLHPGSAIRDSHRVTKNRALFERKNTFFSKSLLDGIT